MPEILFYHHPHHAFLGDQPISIIDPSEGECLYPREVPPLITDTDPFDDRLLHRLDAIVSELEGLRADLASRTLWARLQRAWAWLIQTLGRS